MTLLRERTEVRATGVETAHDAAGLSAIRNAGCAAVVWRRRPSAGFQAWIDDLEPERLPAARVVLRPRDVRVAMSEICDRSGTPDCRERSQMVEDVAALADAFCTLTRAPRLRLRLSVVTTNACRKFHIDAVEARLICTYRGAGTQYGNSVGGNDPQRFSTAPTGAPLLLRGKLWPENPKANLLHRSPPIEGTGETRLVLVLDPIID